MNILQIFTKRKPSPQSPSRYDGKTITINAVRVQELARRLGEAIQGYTTAEAALAVGYVTFHSGGELLRQKEKEKKNHD